MEEDAAKKKDAQFATNNIMIDLMKGMFVLKALGEHCCIPTSAVICHVAGDDVLASWSKADLENLNSVNDARNNSILAHGHAVIRCQQHHWTIDALCVGGYKRRCHQDGAGCAAVGGGSAAR